MKTKKRIPRPTKDSLANGVDDDDDDRKEQHT